MRDEMELRRIAKAALRRQMTAIRKKISPAVRTTRSTAIIENVVALSTYQTSAVFAAFVPMASEVDIFPLLERASDEGKVVVLPYVADRHTQLELRIWQRDHVLESSVFGFKQPAASAGLIDPRDIDLIVVPCLAVDPRGHRVGYGKGFYDRLLCQLPKAMRVGVIYDFQWAVEIPETPGDERLHITVSDARV